MRPGACRASWGHWSRFVRPLWSRLVGQTGTNGPRSWPTTIGPGSLVPVQSRTGTNVSIGPGSCGQGPAGPRGGIGPGSSGPFGPGWWDKPGPMGLAPGPPPLVPVGGLNRDQRLPFSPGSCHQPGPMKCLYIPPRVGAEHTALFFSGRGGEGLVVL